MTLQERLHDAECRSVQVYQRRTAVAGQQQQIAQQAHALDLEFAKLDGEIRVLKALIADAEKASAASG